MSVFSVMVRAAETATKFAANKSFSVTASNSAEAMKIAKNIANSTNNPHARNFVVTAIKLIRK